VSFGQSPKISQRERGNGFGEMNAELGLLTVDIDASKSFLRYIQLDSADRLRKKSGRLLSFSNQNKEKIFSCQVKLLRNADSSKYDGKDIIPE